MSELSKIKRELSQLEKTERELNLKQLQINGLLGITQAINNNVSAEGLYEMYASFVGWEMAVEKVALLVKEDSGWVCKVHRGIDEELIKMDISDRLPNYQRLKNIEEDKDHPLIKEFDVVIPVLHKNTPIAYSFFGGFSKDDDMYSKVKFITTITNIIAVAIENKRLFKRQIEQERLNREMELAGDMQKMLIPNELPQNKEYEFAGIYKPHLGLGGDYYDFFRLNENEYVFCIADVSGKGLSAAMLMANFQATLKANVKYNHGNLTLVELVSELNKSIVEAAKGEKFITFFIGYYNEKTRILKFINAGHNYPILIHQNNFKQLKTGSTALGIFDPLPEIQSLEIEIKPNTIIVCFTDGLVEVENTEGEQFQTKRLADSISSYSYLNMSELNKAIIRDVDKFKGENPYPDDTAILSLRII